MIKINVRSLTDMSKKQEKFNCLSNITNTFDEMKADEEAFCLKQLQLPKEERFRAKDGVSYAKCKECGKPFSYCEDECSDGICSTSCGIASQF